METPASYMTANYPVSTDYKQLASLARQCSVICIVDYEKVGAESIRDVASTSYSQHRDNEVFQVGARGISYIYAFSEEEFIKLCQHRNLEFIVPESVKTAETEQPAQPACMASECRLPVVHIGRTLDELDAKVWPFIEEKAKGVGPVHGRIETYGYELGNGGVVVLWDGESIHAMVVTVRDGLNRTVCVRMSADDSQPASSHPEAVPVSDATRVAWTTLGSIKATLPALLAFDDAGVRENAQVVSALVKMVEQKPVAVPDEITVSMAPHSQYAKGWNACRSAMLSAVQKPEGVR